MDNINKLNSQLNQFNEDFKLASSMNNFDTQLNMRGDDNVKELFNKSIEETNSVNDKYSSFFTDSSVCINNNNAYYKTSEQIIPTNTNQNLYNNSRNDNEMNNEMNNVENGSGGGVGGVGVGGSGGSSGGGDVNEKMEQFQFKHTVQHNEIYNPHNTTYNQISPFINEQDYNKKKNVNLTNTRLDEYSPMGRSIVCPPNIDYQVNENAINNRPRTSNKDIANQRLEQFSPLSRAVQLPTKKSPLKNDTTSKFLNTENTFSQNSLNTNYKKFANQPKKSHFNDVNPANENQFLKNNPVGTRLL